MTDDSKKLTVSFGAFSCTLDGFDDPMPVLSRVLEQIQAVSKDDPAFGTVPVTAHSAALQSAAAAAGATAETSDTVLTLRPAAPSNVPGDFDAPDEIEPLEENWESYSVGEAADLANPATWATDISNDEDTAEASETDWDTGAIAAVGAAPSEDTPDSDAAFLERVSEAARAAETPQGAAVEPVALAFGAPQAAAEPQPAQADEDISPASVASHLAEEEAAIERMLSATREQGFEAPSLAPSNPLARLREQTQALVDDSAFMAPTPAPDRTPEAPAPDTQLDLSAQIGDSTHAPLRLDAPLVPVEADAETSASETPPQDATTQEISSSDTLDAESREFIAALTRNDPAPTPASDHLTAAPPVEPLKDAPQMPEVPQADDAPIDAGILRLVPASHRSEPVPADPPARAPGPESAEELRQFAAAMGAASLPEMMEASAAYVTLVSGRSAFTRREIFEHFDVLSGDAHISFEARIKTLSRLLRTGILERSEDGSFSMSTAARAQYEERASA